MSQIILHKEVIDKPNKKVVFQIKIPSNVKAVTGVMFGAILKGDTGIMPFKRHSGELQLNIPEKRGVFYSESLRIQGMNDYIFEPIGQLGLIVSSQWIHKGTKWEFEDIHIPVEHTIIDGFYEDGNPFLNGAYYELNIYLRLE